MLYKYSNLFVLLSSSVSAIALNNDPAATKCMVKAEGEAPEPTQPPNAHDLRIRDVPQKTLLAASDNTCGFFGGSTGSSPISRHVSIHQADKDQLKINHGDAQLAAPVSLKQHFQQLHHQHQHPYTHPYPYL
jgi:hypothetical protein